VRKKAQNRLYNHKYRFKPDVRERRKVKDQLYRQRKCEQACLTQHPNPLLLLANYATQQSVLQQPFPPPENPELRDKKDPIIQGIKSSKREQGADIEEDGDIVVTTGSYMNDENDDEFVETEPIDDMSLNHSSDEGIIHLFINTDVGTINN